MSLTDFEDFSNFSPSPQVSDGIEVDGAEPDYENSLSGSGVTNSSQINQALNTEANEDPNLITNNGFNIGTDTGGLIGGTGLGTALGLNPQVNALNKDAPVNSSSSINNEISDLFLRSVVVISGFIFMAIGLSMFKNSGK